MLCECDHICQFKLCQVVTLHLDRPRRPSCPARTSSHSNASLATVSVQMNFLGTRQSRICCSTFPFAIDICEHERAALGGAIWCLSGRFKYWSFMRDEMHVNVTACRRDSASASFLSFFSCCMSDYYVCVFCAEPVSIYLLLRNSSWLFANISVSSTSSVSGQGSYSLCLRHRLPTNVSISDAT